MPMFDLRNPYITKRHRGGKGRKERLLYHPDPNYNGSIIESSAFQGYALHPTVATALFAVNIFPLSKANGSRTITKINAFCRTATASPTANLYLMPVGGDEDSAIPTGDWATKGGVVDEYAADFAFANGVWNEITLAGGDYAPATGSQIALVWDHTGGTSFQLGGNTGPVMAGVRTMWAAALSNNIQDTVWQQFDNTIPAVSFQYSDGARESFILGMAAGTAATTKIAGAYASGGVAGVGFKPDEDVACNVISCYLGTGGTTTSAGIAIMQVFRASNLVTPLCQSVNSYDTSTSCLSSSARWLKDFFFEDFTFERGTEYYIVVTQVGSAGDATNYVMMGCGATTNYVTGNAPPRTFSENNYHGFFSVSSTTGVANLASDVTNGYAVRIGRRPLTRTSQIFT